jgi:hypothetical protein
LVFLTAYDQHSGVPLLLVLLIVRRNTIQEKYTRFSFKVFKFGSLSGKLVALLT